MKKIFFVLTVLFSLNFAISAVDFEVGFQWDTYHPEKEKGVPGFTFDISEKLSENFNMFATIENLYALNYNAAAGGSFFTDNFNLSAAAFFALRSGKFSPGIMLDTSVTIKDFVTFALESDFAFSPNDFSENSLMLIIGGIIFHTKNSDLTLQYKYDHYFKTAGFENKHSAKVDILAFEKDFPFKIGVFFGAGGEKHSYDPAFFDLSVDVGGTMIFDFGKGGSYILKGESEVFRMLRTNEEKIPFAVSFAVGFTIE